MCKHFHTEKSGDSFLSFHMKISSASNAYEGKYFEQNVLLPTQKEHCQKVCEFSLFCEISTFWKNEHM